MTTLVAYQKKDWAVLGCDSRSAGDDGKYIIPKTAKIVDNNGILVGVYGSERVANIVHYGFKFPKPRKGQNLYEFMSATFIPKLREEFVRHGVDFTKDEESIKGSQFDGGLILAIKGQLFAVASDYSWETSERGLFYLGTGGDYAVASAVTAGLEKSKDAGEAAKIIKKAIGVAIDFDNNSGDPIHTFIQSAI